MTPLFKVQNPEQLTLLAFLKAKKGRGPELGRRLLSLHERSRAEEGCVNYDLHQSNEDPDVWMLYENWRRPADLDAHFEFQYVKDFVAGLGDVLDGDMDLRRFTMATPFVPPRL